MSAFRIALAQYPIGRLENFEAYERKITAWVEDAAGKGTKLLVFPEYGSMELVSFLPSAIASDLQRSIDAMQEFWPAVQKLHETLAARHDVYILGASFPAARKNVAAFYAPNGNTGYQEKLIMTRFEREEWHINAGDKIKVFDTALGRIGVAICYDSEFPLIARAMAEAGAQVILVPSCTDSAAGYNRVKIGAMARALENQCYTAQSPAVGDAPWSPATDVNIGAAGLYGPPDLGFPEAGIIAQGEMNKAQWVYGDIDLKKIDHVRKDGAVLNDAHWREQARLSKAEIIRTG